MVGEEGSVIENEEERSPTYHIQSVVRLLDMVVWVGANEERGQFVDMF